MDTRIKVDPAHPGRTEGGDVRVSGSSSRVPPGGVIADDSVPRDADSTDPESTTLVSTSAVSTSAVSTSAVSTSAVSSLERITAVLDTFSAAHDRMGVNEIARRSGLPKSTTSRLVSSLVNFGYLRRDGQQLSIGLKLFELGRLSRRPNTLRSLALPTMVDLRASTLHTVQLSVLEDLDVVTIAILPGRDASVTSPQVGRRAPACSTGAGRAMMAFADGDVVERAVRRAAGGPPMLRDLEVARRNRVLVSAEGGPGTTAAASPVLSRDGRVVAALSVTGRTAHFDPDRTGAAVCAAAFRLGRLDALDATVSGLS
jgi:IclR family acetate operon transcriptional repressor